MPAVKFTAIKPAKFQSDAFDKRMKWAVDQTVKETEKLFAQTVETWEHKPAFAVEKSNTAEGISGSVSTDDENYARVNKGVEGGYKIPKAGPGLLVFSEGYKAKSTPGVLKAKEGGSYGDVIFRYTQVTAKGFPGRHFDELVRVRMEPWFKHRVEIAMKEAAKASGHGVK